MKEIPGPPNKVYKRYTPKVLLCDLRIIDSFPRLGPVHLPVPPGVAVVLRRKTLVEGPVPSFVGVAPPLPSRLSAFGSVTRIFIPLAPVVYGVPVAALCASLLPCRTRLLSVCLPAPRGRRTDATTSDSRGGTCRVGEFCVSSDSISNT